MLHAVACLVTAVSLIAGSPSLLSASGTGFPASPSRIVGRVIDGKTRAGIGAVRVRLDDGRAETTTAPDGGFEFADVPAGRHAVVAILEGFAPSAPVQVVVETDADARVEIEYGLGVTTEVRGTPPAPPAVPPPASLGLAELSGLQIASAVGGLDDLLRVMQQRPGVAASQDNRNDVMVRGGGRDGDRCPAGRVRTADGQPLRVARRRWRRAEPHPVGGGRSGGGRDQRVLRGVRRTGVGPARHRHQEGRDVAGPGPRRGRRRRRARARRGPAARGRRAGGFVARVGAPESSSRSPSPTAIRGRRPATSN